MMLRWFGPLISMNENDLVKRVQENKVEGRDFKWKTPVQWNNIGNKDWTKKELSQLMLRKFETVKFGDAVVCLEHQNIRTNIYFSDKKKCVIIDDMMVTID